MWPTIEGLIHDAVTREAAFAELAVLASAMSDEDRRGCVAPLRALARPAKGEFLPWGMGPALALAGAAILPSPSALAPWLLRYPLSYAINTQPPGRVGDYRTGDVVEHLGSVLEERAVPWLPDLVDRVAARLPTGRRNDGRLYRVIERFRRGLHLAPPTTSGFAAGLVMFDGPSAFAAALETDGRFAALLPNMFDVDDICVRLGYGDEWPRTFASLVERGLLDRATVLDLALGKLQRGGRPSASRAVLAVYDALEPTVEEIAARLRDHLVLLPDALSVVAGRAQELLRSLDEHGLIGIDEIAEASFMLLLRPEKKLVRAQLRWLRGIAARDPGTAGRTARAVATGLAHPAVDVQREVVALVGDLTDHLAADDRADILAAAEALPVDLRAVLRGALGAQPVRPDPTGEPTRVLAVPDRGSDPPLRYEAMAELVEELVASLHTGLVDAEPLALERCVEGLVRFSWEDRHALRAALRPVFMSQAYQLTFGPLPQDMHVGDSWYWSLRADVLDLAAASVGDPAPPGPGTDPNVGPAAALGHRIREMAAGLRRSPVPAIVSFPSRTTGVLDAGDLLERLAAAAAEGWTPVDVDLDQALLRLDVGVDAGVTAAFRELGTAAGARVARWIEHGQPRAEVVPAVVQQRQFRWFGEDAPIDVLLARAGHVGEPSDVNAIWTIACPVDPEDQGRPWDVVLNSWAAVLPHHRDVTAAHCIRTLAADASPSGTAAALLPVLAEASGPTGFGTALAFAYCLGASARQRRAFAVDGLLILDARGQLDGVTLGHTLAELISRGGLVGSRLVEPLQDAANGGAAGSVWTVVETLLGDLLMADQGTTRMADLLALAAAVAEMAAATTEPPGLAAFAAGRGRSRQLVEARRLLELLRRGADRA